MKNSFILMVALACAIFCIPQVYAGGGNGGPIVTYGIMDLSPLNDYTTANGGIPPFDTNVIMWGGSGTSWLSRSFGLGVTVIGGTQVKQSGANYASLYSVIGTYNLENILFETRTFIFGMRFGFGYCTNHFVINQNAQQSEFIIDSLLFPISFTSQMKITEVMRVELALNYYLITGDEWVRASGTFPVDGPGNTSLNYLTASASLRFGSRYISDSGGGIILKSPAGGANEGIIQGGGY